MKYVQGEVTLSNYRQFIEYEIIRDILEEGKVLIHYVEAKGQHMDVRTQPLDWKTWAPHVGALNNPNTNC